MLLIGVSRVVGLFKPKKKKKITNCSNSADCLWLRAYGTVDRQAELSIKVLQYLCTKKSLALIQSIQNQTFITAMSVAIEL